MKNTKRKSKLPITIAILILILISLLLLIYFKNQNSNNNNDKISNINNEETKSPSTDTLQNNIPVDRFEGLTLTDENIGIPVLYYHSVDPSEANEVIISPDKLKEQLTYIKDSGYTTLTMKEVYDYILNNKPIPEKSILITFDDGYMDNYVNAFPILKELDMKATIFVIANGIDDGYYMSSEQLKEMSDYGIDIESHTFSHGHLDTMSYEEQLQELKSSKEIIEGITGKTVLSVAYPFGDYNEDSIRASRDAGYALSFTTNRGLADRDDNPLSLDRIYVSSYYTMDEFKERLKNTQK